MRIFSALGVAYSGFGTGAEPPTPLAKAGALTDELFEDFAEHARSRGDSLCTAMYNNFMGKILLNKKLPIGKSLNQAIEEKYSTLNAAVAVNGPNTEEELFDFLLYLYIGIFHFSVWMYKENGDSNGRLGDEYKDYIKSKLKKTYFPGDLRVAKSVVNDSDFDWVFKMDGRLLAMKERLQPLMETDGKGNFKNIVMKKGSAATVNTDRAASFKVAVLKWLRDESYALVDHDVRYFLGKLATDFPVNGSIIRDGYSGLSFYATGEGEETVGMFGTKDRGVLFMRYEISTKYLPGKLFIKDIPLLGQDERDLAATFFYLALDSNKVAGTAPFVFLRGYKGTVEQPPPPSKGHLLEALRADSHIFARAGKLPTETVQMSDLGNAIDSVKFDLFSQPGLTDASIGTSGEEMVFLVFKHRLKDPVRKEPPPSPPVFLSTERSHADNEYQKLLSPASGTAAAVVEPALFAQPQADLANLAAALAADPGFEVDVVIEGLGVGEILPVGSFGKGGRGLAKADDQSDRPPGAGYDPLRHDYGWLEWHPGSSGGSGWLTGHVTGFVSPLRCTFETYFTPAKKALLDTQFKHRMVKDKQGRPIYNCLLSAFRAFSLFHAMMEQLSSQLDAIGSPGAAAAKQKLVDYLKNEAGVEVVLPTGMKMSGGPLKHDDIVPFY